MTDTEFIAALRNYLSQFSENRWPVVPRVYTDNAGEVLDRQATLKLVVYDGMDKSGLL